MVRRCVSPKVRLSEGSLVRVFNIPKVRFSEGPIVRIDNKVWLSIRTVGPYRRFRLPNFRTSEHSDQWTFGLMNLRTIVLNVRINEPYFRTNEPPVMEKLCVRTIEPSGKIKYYPVYHYVNKVQFQSQCLITLDPQKQDIVSLYVSNCLRFDFFLFFRQCWLGVLLLDAAKHLKIGSGCMCFLQIPSMGGCGLRKSDSQEQKWSGPTSFSALRSEHFEPSCFESGIHHTFDMKKKVILKHDAIPAIPTTFPE